eukprot:Gb_20599 [translate_table: standard]
MLATSIPTPELLLDNAYIMLAASFQLLSYCSTTPLQATRPILWTLTDPLSLHRSSVWKHNADLEVSPVEKACGSSLQRLSGINALQRLSGASSPSAPPSACMSIKCCYLLTLPDGQLWLPPNSALDTPTTAATLCSLVSPCQLSPCSEFFVLCSCCSDKLFLALTGGINHRHSHPTASSTVCKECHTDSYWRNLTSPHPQPHRLPLAESTIAGLTYHTNCLIGGLSGMLYKDLQGGINHRHTSYHTDCLSRRFVGNHHVTSSIAQGLTALSSPPIASLGGLSVISNFGHGSRSSVIALNLGSSTLRSLRHYPTSAGHPAT